jgi:hypothetical protein
MGTVLEATGYGKADLRSTRLLGQREDCATPSSDQFPLNFCNHSLMMSNLGQEVPQRSVLVLRCGNWLTPSRRSRLGDYYFCSRNRACSS